MQISILLAQQIAQLFLILIMGYAVVKAGLLKASDSKVLSVLMVYLVCPCMILNAFQIEDTPDIRRGLVYAMIVAAAMHVVLLAFTALLRRPLKLDVIEQVNTIYSNAGALVIPLVQALLGSEYVIYSCAFIIVQTVLIWTHANACRQGSFSFQWKKLLENVNILAILAGMLLTWTPRDYISIEGVQGRYFIPFMPALALVGRNGRLMYEKSIDLGLMYAGFIGQLLTVMYLIKAVLIL